MTAAVLARRLHYAIISGAGLLALLTGCRPPVAVPPQPAEAAAIAQTSGDPNTYALGVLLAREQQHGKELESQLAARTTELDQLHKQVDALTAHEAELRTALERKGGSKGRRAASGQGAEEGGPAGGSSSGALSAGSEPAAAGTASAAEMLALHTELSDEQQRRSAAEDALARLKEETSTPPYGDGAPDLAKAQEENLANARQEIADLHQALDEERTTRERLAKDLRDMQERASHAEVPTPDAQPADAELRARLEGLQAEKQSIIDSFNRTLASSQEHAADLEKQLAAGRAAVGGSADVGAFQAENAALRARLNEEHRRTEELSNKLKLAARVTDLIFKMQGQQMPPSETESRRAASRFRRRLKSTTPTSQFKPEGATQPNVEPQR